MISFWHQYPTICSFAAYFIFSAFVSGMPAPEAKDGRGYTWLYNSLHKLSGDFSDLIQAKLKGLPDPPSMLKPDDPNQKP